MLTDSHADVPADGIGGTTNVIMRNPLDLTGRHISRSVYYGWNENGGDAQDREPGDLIDRTKRLHRLGQSSPLHLHFTSTP